MATAFTPTTTNPHIAALESVFGNAKKPVEWLVIAHTDPRMLGSLIAALSGA